MSKIFPARNFKAEISRGNKNENINYTMNKKE